MMIDYNALICGRVIINKKCFGARISKTAHSARFITLVHCLPLGASADDDDEVFFRPSAKFACILFYSYNVYCMLYVYVLVIIHITVELQTIVPRGKSKTSTTRIIIQRLSRTTRKIRKSVLFLFTLAFGDSTTVDCIIVIDVSTYIYLQLTTDGDVQVSTVSFSGERWRFVLTSLLQSNNNVI